MMRTAMFCAAIMTAAFLAGCDENISAQKPADVKVPGFDALYAETPVNIDGKLDDAVWKKAKIYQLSCPLANVQKGESLQEGGVVQFAWDDKYLYVAGKFSDSDIQANGTEDNMHHYKWGDLMELFLWPQDFTWYWELYVTPLSKKTTFFFPGPGYLGMENCFQYKCDMTVAAQCNGTVNKWDDVDLCWTAEMAVPVSELTKRGEKFGPGSNWRVLVGRYNYCVYIDKKGPELSSCPGLTIESYHMRAEYGKINFTK